MDDFWGKEGCNEILVLSRPDIIKDIHAAFFNVGCDVVETDTFGATRVVLAEYDLQDKVHEINCAAAKLAREVAASFNGRKRFVAGSMGPTTKLPSLGHISFDDMAASYTEQAVALIEGGVDVLLLETCQDILQAKAGLVGIFDALKKTGKNVPVQVQVTLGSHRHDAAGHRDRRGADHAGDVRRRRHRPELRHRPEGDERRRSLPRREFAQACLGAAQCGLAAERGRRRAFTSCSRRNWPTITSSSSPSTVCALSAAAAAPRPST